MARYTIKEDSKLPGHFRVVDSHTGDAITGARPYASCDALAQDYNASYTHEADRGALKTQVLCVLLIVFALVASALNGWDDSKTYALNHGTEVFE